MTTQGWNDPRVPGARRQKVLGYIRAANELRQSYQTQLSSRMQSQEYEGGMPGAFPDADIVRSGDEELLLFPSYARKHVKQSPSDNKETREIPGARETINHPDTGDADYWRREWQKYEDENAVVDVDVRGWIYSPAKGPLSRRNRLLVAVARRLSGIPAPETLYGGATHNGSHDAYQESIGNHEEEAAAREAEIITRRGQQEAEAASRGNYSISGNATGGITPVSSRSNSPSRSTRTAANEELHGDNSELGLNKRQSWNSAAMMSREELVAANEQLMNRLRPFMTMPLANTPISIFFFNDQKSQSKSVYTDESGHFKVRAALDFVPSKVRVLASEALSATEDVLVTDPTGISLVSDIDDTIKHSAIASGAREIFKNTFIRELGDLIIDGVKEWYSEMAQLGVKLHYVSNSPWQLYPLLRSYFSMAGLPPGSFHLKQYSGMLQGIFEPAAERKKGSLDRIMTDFPERKFILVGDSGEADLEVYTDVVLDHPGRVLGVFIRDVTSSDKTNFFDSAQAAWNSGGNNKSNTEQHNTSTFSDSPQARPNLPQRPKQENRHQEDLIDFSEDPVEPVSITKTESSYSQDLRELNGNGKPTAPSKPAKPSNLRSFSTASPPILPTQTSPNDDSTADREPKRGPVPPKPRRPSSVVGISSSSTAEPSQPQKNALPAPPTPRLHRPHLPHRTFSGTSQSSMNSSTYEEGYIASARRQLTSAYNALPPLRSQSPSRDGVEGSPPSMRRGLTSYPAAAARWATGASGGDPAAGGDGGAPGATYDKKLEMWKRRWARAEEIMKRQGVVLRSWRVGSDVKDECIKLVKQAERDSHTIQ